MVQIDWSIAQNALAQPNPGERFQFGFQQGQQQRRQREMDGALNALAANPDDPKAIAGYMRVDPRGGLQYQQQRAAFAEDRAKREREREQEERKIFARAAKLAKDPASWDAIVDQLTPQYPEVAAYRGKFDPNLRASLMALGGESEDRETQGPASVQEYEYAKAQGFTGSYMDFVETKRGPIVANNGDGTFTIIPRGMVPGGASGASEVPPPPPGFVLDSDGGPTPPASGTFQP